MPPIPIGYGIRRSQSPSSFTANQPQPSTPPRRANTSPVTRQGTPGRNSGQTTPRTGSPVTVRDFATAQDPFGSGPSIPRQVSALPTQPTSNIRTRPRSTNINVIPGLTPIQQTVHVPSHNGPFSRNASPSRSGSPAPSTRRSASPIPVLTRRSSASPTPSTANISLSGTPPHMVNWAGMTQEERDRRRDPGMVAAGMRFNAQGRIESCGAYQTR